VPGINWSFGVTKWEDFLAGLEVEPASEQLYDPIGFADAIN